MYRSAHTVLFLNYDDFNAALDEKIGPEKTTFFSGYDGDSLALEPFSGFLDHFLPFIESRPTAELELRTKSLHIQKLLKRPALPNVVVAYTLSPEKIAETYEPKTPPLKKRLEAISKLQAHGWQIGLRFDPLLYVENYQDYYAPFFEEVLSLVKNPHSITLGTFRLPTTTYKEMERVKPKEELLAICSQKGNMMAFTQEDEMLSFCKKHLPKEKVFVCQT